MRSLWRRILHDEGGWVQYIPAVLAGGKMIYDIVKGKDKGPDIPAPPDYYEDPDYRKTQDYLRDLGIDVLGGKIPEYYAGIGQAGGPEFENYLNLMTGDIKEAGLETAAAMGRGGGAVTDITSRAVGEASTKARYADFLRAMEGKQWLFGKGQDITEGVRAAGQAEGANRNTFNLKQYGLNVDKIMADWGINRQLEQEYGELIGSDISNLLGAGYGGATGGWQGGLSGMMGGADWTKIFDSAVKPKSGDIYAGVMPGRKNRLGAIMDDSDLDEAFYSIRKGRKR